MGFEQEKNMSDLEYQPWVRNEANKNSKGGSELMMEGIVSRMDPELLSHFQLIASRVREIREDKIRIYHLHDLPEDPETNHLKNSSSRDRFHKQVYCGNWQYARYRGALGVPHDGSCVVLETAIDPIVCPDPKPTDEVRLVYTSTPQRGLEVLIPVFKELCNKHDNIVLDVFSSFNIYGWAESDKPFEKLFDECRNHPKINYHGAQPNEVVREALKRAHILAYPSIWEECNSRSVIEAMSAGLLCVHPNYGGLPDTAGGLNFMYQWDSNKNTHANKFYQVLDNAIGIVNTENIQNYLRMVKMYADSRYNWTKVASQWEDMLKGLKLQYPTAESRKVPGLMFHYKTS
jgi:glycosyltransferase involved in cell wall biosynthesis